MFLIIWILKFDAILVKKPFARYFSRHIRVTKCKTIHIVALENDVKELLWELHKDYTGTIEIKTINLLKDKTETFDFNWNTIPYIKLQHASTVYMNLTVP
jgi:hypothetical protein